jgi:uncharacterized phiE125 gp8 family phage protein
MLTPLAPFDGETILPLADAKVQLNIAAESTFHDDAVTDARDAAVGWCEGYSGKSLQERDFLWIVDQFKSVMSLPIGPATAATISYYDNDGVDTEVDAADFYLGNDNLSAAISATWPSADGRPGGVRITVTAGYALPADIPPYLLSSVKLATAAMFENRSNPDLSGAMRCADQFRSVL